jgi:hypothetical protein
MSSSSWLDSEASRTEDFQATNNRPAHARKTSSLSVAAKEFKFNPKNAFQPSNFLLSEVNFQAPVVVYPVFNPIHVV